MTSTPSRFGQADSGKTKVRKSSIPIVNIDKPKIVIIGGGIAGMTVAHELVQHYGGELEIVILEKHSELGGKARTKWDKDKFSEHSMRVLPGSYVCLHQIMEEIPHGDGKVIDRLKPVRINLSHKGVEYTILGDYRARFLGSFKYAKDVIGLLWYLTRIGVRIRDLVVFLGKVGVLFFLPSRRVTEDLSRLKFSEYIGGEDGKPGRFSLIYRLAEILVAAKSHSSAGVVSHTLLEWFVTPFLRGKYARSAISEFDMATSAALIEPWKAFLESPREPVRFKKACVETIEANAGRVTEVVLDDGSTIEGDVYVLAVQHNIANVLIGDGLRKHLPELSDFSRLGEEWAHSVQFQIPELSGKLKDLNSTAVAAMDSPWSVAYRVYSASTWHGDWPGPLRAAVFTATISNTKRRGKIFDLPFLRCTPDQILAEVISQTGLEEELDAANGTLGLDLKDFETEKAQAWQDKGYAVATFGPKDERVFVTDAQMYIRLPGNLDIEPENSTGAYNFFLAGEYTRTKYRIPTMEKSCESGKRCARSICEVLGGNEPREIPVCRLPLEFLRGEYFHMVAPRVFWIAVVASTIWLLAKQIWAN